MRFLIVALVALLPLHTTSHSLCDTLYPFNGIPPMISNSPFTILTSVSTAHQSEILTIRIKSALSELKFGGFTIHAHGTSPPYQILGSFIPSRAGLKLSNCNGENNIATYYAFPADNSEFELQWQAPSDYVGEISFQSTITTEFDQFWTWSTSSQVNIVPKDNGQPLLSLISPNSLKTDPQLTSNNEERRSGNHIYDDCGTFKTCFGLPNDCVEQQSCETIATANVVNNRYQFELRSTAVDVSYVALSLSKGGAMGEDLVVGCTQEEGTVQLFSSWNTGRPGGVGSSRQEAAQNVNQLLDSSFVNGTLYCKYERNAFGTESAIDVDLMSQNFRILVSSGTSVSNTAPSYNNRMASGVSTAYNKPLEKVEARNADLSIYNGCGVSKTCFGMPANCVASQTCESVVTATSIGNRFEFELQTQNSNAGYISLGLSRDHLMGDDSVMECVVENSEVRGYTSWNYRRTNSRVDVSQDIVRLLNSSFANGVLYCKLERMPTSQKRETDFDLLIEDFYFMIALGTAFTSGSISMHNLGRLSSSGPLQILETPPPIYEPPPVYDGCGTEKTCFGFPDNCLEEQSCRAVVTAAFVNEKYVFELQSSVNGTRYVAFGLSKDEFMGSDSVIECIAEGGNITAHTSWNTPRTTFENTRQGVQQYIITLLNSSYTDGTLYCKVERQAVTTVIEKTFDLDNDHFYYMVAIGSIVRENSVGMHNLGRDVSSEPLRFPGREDEGEGGANGLAKISVVALLVSFLATNFLR